MACLRDSGSGEPSSGLTQPLGIFRHLAGTSSSTLTFSCSFSCLIRLGTEVLGKGKTLYYIMVCSEKCTISELKGSRPVIYVVVSRDVKASLKVLIVLNNE